MPRIKIKVISTGGKITTGCESIQARSEAVSPSKNGKTWLPFLCEVKRMCRAGFSWASSPSGVVLQATLLGGEGHGSPSRGPCCVGLQGPGRPNSTAVEASAPLPGVVERLLLRWHLLWQLWEGRLQESLPEKQRELLNQISPHCLCFSGFAGCAVAGLALPLCP